MYKQILLELPKEFHKEIIDRFDKSIKCKKISDTSFLIKTNDTSLNIKDRIMNDGVKIISEEVIYEAEDVDFYDYFYCSGQKIPNTSIYLSKNVENNLSTYFCLDEYCPKCKLGLIQISSLEFSGNLKKVLENKFITPYWSFWIISEDIKKSFEASGLTGVKFLSVYDAKGKLKENIYQMMPAQQPVDDCIRNCLVPRKKYSECNCTNQTYVFKDINKIVLSESSKKHLLDFNELKERTDKYKGIYIVSKRFVKEFINNELYPGKNFMIMPVLFE